MIGDRFDPFDFVSVSRMARSLVGNYHTIYYPRFYKYTNFIRNFIIVITNKHNSGIIHIDAGAKNFKDLLDYLGVNYLRLVMKKGVKIRLNPSYRRYVDRVLEVYEHRNSGSKTYVLWFYNTYSPSNSIRRVIDSRLINNLP